MLLQLVLVVNSKEVALEIFFKRAETFDKWVNHHYLCISALVDVLAHTREFTVVKRTVKS